MLLVAEREVPDAPPPQPSPTIQTATPTRETTRPLDHLQQEYVHRAAWKAGVLGALNFAVRVLSARLILLCSVLGSVFLAWLALSQPDLTRLAVLGVYTTTVLLPLTWLAGQK
jgi:hypothetical protein